MLLIAWVEFPTPSRSGFTPLPSRPKPLSGRRKIPPPEQVSKSQHRKKTRSYQKEPSHLSAKFTQSAKKRCYPYRSLIFSRLSTSWLIAGLGVSAIPTQGRWLSRVNQLKIRSSAINYLAMRMIASLYKKIILKFSWIQR